MTTKEAHIERRSFGIHPAILLTLMREQAGSVEKALAELVMNSVDARSTRIDITTSDTGFSIADDGKGFTSIDQLETFFDMFGTPHEAGDAYYGRFRVGRGQIMSYAKTTWRSGPFEMRVDIDPSAKDIGYDLVVHKAIAPGCRVDGEFIESHTAYALRRNYGDPHGWGGFVGVSPDDSVCTYPRLRQREAVQ